jgi:hypothetical protein
MRRSTFIFTTIPLHRKILADPHFRAGKFDTRFIERFLGEEREVGAVASRARRGNIMLKNDGPDFNVLN